MDISGLSGSGNSVLKVMSDRVQAMRMDCIARGIGRMPETWEWLSEHEVKRDFAMASGSTDNDDEDSARAFGKAMAQCERLGLVERGEGPGCTSIKLRYSPA
jgi:hypothetical protein